jgi:hypothetical protein
VATNVSSSFRGAADNLRSGADSAKDTATGEWCAPPAGVWLCGCVAVLLCAEARVCWCVCVSAGRG